MTWRDRIRTAMLSDTSTFTRADKKAVGSYLTCALSEKASIRDFKNIDYAELLGRKFMGAVTFDEPVRAARIYNLIQKLETKPR